jgi:hypothetical protein
MDYEKLSQEMKRFATGFAIGLIAFAVANVAAYFYRSSPPDAFPAYQCYGFPFLVWVRSGIAPPMSVMALCSDIAIAVVFSAAVGWFWGRRVARGRRKV